MIRSKVAPNTSRMAQNVLNIHSHPLLFPPLEGYRGFNWLQQQNHRINHRRVAFVGVRDKEDKNVMDGKVRNASMMYNNMIFRSIDTHISTFCMVFQYLRNFHDFPRV